jgi:hypothetical protein
MAFLLTSTFSTVGTPSSSTAALFVQTNAVQEATLDAPDNRFLAAHSFAEFAHH